MHATSCCSENQTLLFATMDEIGNYDRERLPFWWKRQWYSEQFDWHAITDGDGHGHNH